MKPDVDGRFWLNVEGKGFLGLGRIELLEQIDASGSISAAARAMGMSYKAAWDAIDAMNNLADESLLIRQVGGRHGGGTQLTAYGKRVIAQYRAAEHEYQCFMNLMRENLEQLGLGDPPDAFNFIRRFAMRTSARNQFQGKVIRFGEGAVNDVITVDIGSGIEISSVITHEAAQALDLLREGRAVQVLIKASFVVLCEDVDGTRYSARNRLCGAVSRIQPGAVNAEVKLDLSAGRTLTAIVTMAAVNEGWLKEGGRACALIKAPHVILAVTD
jgi:molybdate transport system regulatory protein